MTVTYLRRTRKSTWQIEIIIQPIRGPRLVFFFLTVSLSFRNTNKKFGGTVQPVKQINISSSFPIHTLA